jgi:hypothetical protein
MNDYECQVCGRHIFEDSNRVPIEIEGQPLGHGHKRCVQYIETLTERTEFFRGCMNRAASLARYYQSQLDEDPLGELLEDIRLQLEAVGMEHILPTP